MAEVQQTAQDCLTSMLQRLQRVEQKVESHMKFHIQDLALQILLVAFGIESLPDSPVCQLPTLDPEQERVRAVAAALLMLPSSVASHANALIQRRSNIVSCQMNWQILDKQVPDICGLISTDLQADLKWECMIIQHYNVIRESVTIHSGNPFCKKLLSELQLHQPG